MIEKYMFRIAALKEKLHYLARVNIQYQHDEEIQQIEKEIEILKKSLDKYYKEY